MSRSKSVSDDVLLDRLTEAMRVHGPADLSFARAAVYAGLSASTLVQRFGHRSEMIQAVLLRSWDALDAATAEADAGSGPGREGAVAFLLRLTHGEDVDYNTTDGLLLLREDIRNPVLRARGAAWRGDIIAAVSTRLGETDLAMKQSREMVSLWQGTVFWWAFHREGQLADAVRLALEDYLRERF